MIYRLGGGATSLETDSGLAMRVCIDGAALRPMKDHPPRYQIISLPDYMPILQSISCIGQIDALVLVDRT